MSTTVETARFNYARAVKLRWLGDKRVNGAERLAMAYVPPLCEEIDLLREEVAGLRLIVQMRRDVFAPELLPVHA
jgi:hypothetical protein